MTPEEFLSAMVDIRSRFGDDPESAHSMADDVMLDLLRSLGYGAGAAVFDDMERWYAQARRDPDKTIFGVSMSEAPIWGNVPARGLRHRDGRPMSLNEACDLYYRVMGYLAFTKMDDPALFAEIEAEPDRHMPGVLGGDDWREGMMRLRLAVDDWYAAEAVALGLSAGPRGREVW